MVGVELAQIPADLKLTGALWCLVVVEVGSGVRE